MNLKQQSLLFLLAVVVPHMNVLSPANAEYVNQAKVLPSHEIQTNHNAPDLSKQKQY